MYFQKLINKYMYLYQRYLRFKFSHSRLLDYKKGKKNTGHLQGICSNSNEHLRKCGFINKLDMVSFLVRLTLISLMGFG